VILTLEASPVEEIFWRGGRFFLKRDDRLHPDFSGNKARKFYYFLRRDFPRVEQIVSYGSPQSNAMYSLSVLAKMRGWRFDYYVDHIPLQLREYPVGNYRAALENGTIFHIGRPLESHSDPATLRIEEGGRQKEAEEGVALLAQEIVAWYRDQRIETLTVFLPSGTGTTALYLAKHLSQEGIGVVTTPCVGDGDYLQRQFALLEKDSLHWPGIVDLPRKYHFGRLYGEFWQIWLELYRQTGVEFDLLYDPKGWLTLLKHRADLPGEILYLHQGGLKGNESMRMRYERKWAAGSARSM